MKTVFETFTSALCLLCIAIVTPFPAPHTVPYSIDNKKLSDMPVESGRETSAPIKPRVPILMDNGEVNPNIHGRPFHRGRPPRNGDGQRRRVTYASADTFWGRYTGMVVLEVSESKTAASTARGSAPTAQNKVGLTFAKRKRRRPKRSKRSGTGGSDDEMDEDELTLSPLGLEESRWLAM